MLYSQKEVELGFELSVFLYGFIGKVGLWGQYKDGQIDFVYQAYDLG